MRALPALIEETGLRNETGLLVTKAQATTAFAVDWRNRHIAHRDLRLALEEPLIELAPASRLQVRQALEALVRVLNKVEGHFLGGETAYDIGGDPGDAVSMLYLLRGGVEAEAARRARMSKGEPLESDFPRRAI